MTTSTPAVNVPAVEFRHITKKFGQLTALDDINLAIQPGEIVGIIGYSGAGKSTLVRLINALDTPSSGQVLINGTDIVAQPERERRKMRARIGMIFQQFNLFSSRTAAGNIEYPLKLAGIPKAERKKRVQELLEFVGLADKGSHYPEQLSGGQKQRVGIARALAAGPDILLADEATSALDPETTGEVLKLLRKVNDELGITIVVITHEMEVVRAIADRVAVMEAGRIVEHGSVYEVFSNPQTDVASKFVATSLRNTPDQLEAKDLLTGEGRLFTITLSEHSGFFSAAAKAAEQGGQINIVHGGVTTLQGHSFGKMTVRIAGPDQVVEQFFASLSATTTIEEISR